MTLIIRITALAGAVIATIRSITGLSQGVIGEAAGVAGSQISKYENSQVIPSVEILIRLLHAAGWHLTAMPAIEAETAREREAVIAAVRKCELYENSSYEGHRELAAAMNDLWDAEQRHRGDEPPAGPTLIEELVMLRSQVREQQTELARMRNFLRLAQRQIAGVL